MRDTANFLRPNRRPLCECGHVKSLHGRNGVRSRNGCYVYPCNCRDYRPETQTFKLREEIRAYEEKEDSE